MTLRAVVAADLERYRDEEGQARRSRLRVLLSAPGAQATCVYRIGSRLAEHRATRRGGRAIAWGGYLILARLVEIATGISLSPRARIGPGLYIGHFGGIVVGAGVTLGSHCNLSQGVTIGVGGRGDRRGSPAIGDRAYIGPGAKVFGPIEVGDDVAIGANAVVTESLPARAVAVGVPARVVSYEGSFEFVRYPDMLVDVRRSASLRARDGSDSPAGGDA